MKRILSFLMALTLVFSMFPKVFAEAETAEETQSAQTQIEETTTPAEELAEPVEQEEYSATSEEYAYTVSNGEATITGYTGEGGDITIPDILGGYPVTTIGYRAFYDCDSLTSVTIPDSVTTIGNYTFYACDSLTSVTIPESVESIGEYAFCNCNSLTSVTIPDSVVTIGNSAFHNCGSLTSVTIPNSVTTIGDDAFRRCENLSSITIAESVTTIGDDAFVACDSLTDVYYNGTKEQWDAIAIGEGNELLQYAVIHFADGSVSDLVMIEEGTCGDNLIWTFHENGILTISGTGRMYDYQFVGEEGELADAPWYNTQNSALHWYKVKKIVIDEGVTHIGNCAFVWFDEVTEIVLPDSVVSIGDWAFDGCKSVDSIILPEGLTSIGKGAFNQCDIIDNITIPATVDSIGAHAFAYCDSLTDVYFNGTEDQWNAIEIDEDNNTLLTATIHFTDGSVLEPEYADFEYTVENGEATITGYTGAGGDITIPSILDGYPVTGIGREVFYQNTDLTSVVIPDSVILIGDNVFDGCVNLLSVTLGNGVVELGEAAFMSCRSLTSLTLPNSVTCIGMLAFDGCTGLTNVTIGSGVTTIGEEAFNNCYNLTDVYYGGTQSQWDAISISEGNEPLTNANIHLEETEPETPTDFPVLELGVAQEVTIPEGDVYAYLSFTPTESGYYKFTSISDDIDTCGRLYEVTPEGTVYLTDDDDNGGGYNFLICQPLTAGNTYQLRVWSYDEEPCSFPVLVDNAPALESITFTPITVVEGSTGYYTTDEDTGTKYFHYYEDELLYKSTYTAAFTDGTELSDNGDGLYYDDAWYGFDYTSNQSGENPWTAGNTYYIEVSVLGQTAQVPVTITEAPLESITFTPISVIEHTNGYMEEDWEWDEETEEEVYLGTYYHYDVWDLLYESTYTATFTDGTELSGSDEGFYYDDQWFNFRFVNNQSYENQWTAGNTYYIDVTVMGQTAQIPVTIVASPIENITFTPISVIEHTNGCMENVWGWDEETDEDILLGTYYRYFLSDLLYKSTYTATFTDGTELSGSSSDGGFYYDDQWFGFSCASDQNYENQWTAGNTYYIDVTVMGKTVQVPVTIQALPLESLTFTPVTVMEGTTGYYRMDEDTDTEYFYYNVDSLLYQSTYTATFSDGTELSDSGDGFYYDDQWYGFGYTSDQSGENPWTAGNTYYIEVSFMGHTAQIPVTIVASPLESITFAPISVIEGTYGSMEEDWGWDEETDEEFYLGTYYRYYALDLLYKSTYTATFTDGTELSGSDSGFNYDDQWFDFSCSSDQSYENQWTAGNTYYIDVTVMGKTVQVPVTIEAFPLESLTFTPVTVMEGTDGYYTTDEDTGIEYFRYSEGELLRKSTYTATFTDGTELSGSDYGFYYDDQWYGFDYTSNQSGENPWTAGNTYYIEVSVMGQTAQVPVTITESPLESINFTPISVIEGTYGNMEEAWGWDEETDEEIPLGTYYRYYVLDLLYKSTYTATFTDGTELSGSDSGFNYDDQWYGFSCSSDQSYEKQWTAGNTYYIEVSVMGQRAQVPVTIQALPLESLTFTPVTVMEGTDGYYTTDEDTGIEYFRYSEGELLRKSTYTATFTDGTELSGSSDGFYYDDEWYGFSRSSDQSSENQWTVGNTYYIEVSIMGKTVQVPVSISESPLESITFTPISVIESTNGYMEDVWGWDDETDEEILLGTYYRYYLSNLLNMSTYTATFTDGTVVSRNGNSVIYNGEQYNMVYTAEQSYTNPWTAGNTYYIEVSVMGKTVQVPVTIQAFPLESLTFTPVTVIEGTNGYYATDGDADAEYFYYSVDQLLNKSTYTATFSDGTELSGSDSGFNYDDEWYGFTRTSNQSGENPWTAGNTYYIEVSVMGQTAQVPVTITESPLESITFAPISIIEGTNGNIVEDWGWDEETEDEIYLGTYYHYELSNLLNKSTYTATFTDGTKLSDSGYGFYYDDVWYDFSCFSNQGYENQWTAGNTYYIEVSIMGQRAQVPVTIKASPVASISFEPIALVEHRNGSWVPDGDDDITYFSYDWSYKLNYSITFKDGTVKHGTNYSPVEYDGDVFHIDGYTDNQSGRNPWLAGNTYIGNVLFVGSWHEVYVSVCSPAEEDGFEYIVHNETAIITGCDTEISGDVTIPATLGGYPVTGIDNSVFEDCDGLTAVTIPDSVATIGNYAFYDCSSLTSVTISVGVESIGDWAFCNCSSLTSVIIPDSVESIGDSAFEGCSSLTSVTIPDSVERIGTNAFRYCYELDGIWVSEDNANYSSDDRGVLFDKDKTTLLQAPGTITGSYTVPDSVTSISGYGFYNCYNLTSVTIGNGVETIGDCAFYHCSGLTSITIPDSVKSIGSNAFRYCYKLDGIWVSEDNANYSSDDRGVWFNKDKTTLLQAPGAITGSYAVPDSVTSISDSAFYYCFNLTSVTIGDNVTSIGDDAFYNCYDLTTVTIPESVTAIGYAAFYYCNNLTDVYYAGSKVQWKEIAIGDDNECLLDATVHFAKHIHEYEAAITESTCSAPGYTTYTCDCGDTYTEEIAAFGHYVLEGDREVVTAYEIENDEDYPFALRDGWYASSNKEDNTTSTFTIRALYDFTLVLKYKVSSESGYDELRIARNEDREDVISGEKSERTISLTLEAGDIVSISYRKDGSASDGEDTGYFKIETDSQIVIDNTVRIPIDDIEPTCTDDIVCESCKQTVIEALSHTEVVDAGLEATCKETGLTDGKHCSVCNEVLVAQEEIPALGHKEEILPAVDPTEQTTGLTEGKKCSVCDEILVEQEIVPVLFIGTYTINNGEATITGYTGNGGNITIPTTIDGYPVTAIDKYAFLGCASLTSVTLPDGVTTVGDYAFFDCSDLASVNIPVSVTSIGKSVFLGCDNLTIYGFAGSYAQQYAKANNIPFVVTGGYTASNGDESFATIQEALDAYEGGVIQLQADAGSVTITKDVVIDLNGFSIDAVTVTAGELKLLDSKTDDFTVADGDYGKIAAISGAIVAADGYVAITEADGTSYHKVSAEVADMTLRCEDVGIYFNSIFSGDEIVAEHVESYGVALSVKGEPEIGASGTEHSVFHQFATGENTPSTLLYNVMKENLSAEINNRRAELQVYGRAYIQIGDTYIYGETVSRSLRQQVELADNLWSSLTVEQKAEVQRMYRTFQESMEDWNISNIKNSI